MRIFAFSDIHCDLSAIERIVRSAADYYVLCGDVSDVGDGLIECGKAFLPLGKKLLVIPGNNETQEQTLAWCRDYGFTDFNKKILKLGKYNFAGLGQSVYLPFSNPPNDLSTPGEQGEEWFAKELSNFKDKRNLLLFTHEPPHNSKLDLTRSGVHVGSKSVRDFILEEKPLKFFSGHIHECAGERDILGVTKCYSLGKAGVKLSLD